MKRQSLSRGQLSATPQTVAHQVPLSMGFSRQEYWSGLPFPFSRGSLQGIFLTQRSNLGLPHCRQILDLLAHRGSPLFIHMYTSLMKTLQCSIWSPEVKTSPCIHHETLTCTELSQSLGINTCEWHGAAETSPGNSLIPTALPGTQQGRPSSPRRAGGEQDCRVRR